MITPRAWLTVVRWLLVAVTLAVGVDVARLVGRRPPAVDTAVAAPGAQASTAPLTERQSVDLSGTLLGRADDITRQPRTTPTSAPGKGASPTASASAIPDPGTQMVLVGTIVAPNSSVAIIQISGHQTAVHENDTLGDPAFKISRIRDDSVVMTIEGHPKMLRLPSFQPPGMASPAPPPPAPAAPPAALPPPPGAGPLRDRFRGPHRGNASGQPEQGPFHRRPLRHARDNNPGPP